MSMKVSKITNHAQIEQMRDLWENMLALLPRIHATMPTVVAEAQTKIMRHTANQTPDFGKVILFAFYRLAAVLWRRGEPMTMRQVSAALNVPLSSATRFVDTFVENGFVERLPDPQDRRVVRIALTPSGESLHQAFVEFFDRRLAEFLTHFDTRERVQLLALFEKTVTVLQKIHSEQ